MTTDVVRFASLPDEDRAVTPLPELAGLADADRIELRVRHGDGERIVAIPAGAAIVVEAVLTRLLRGERVAVLAEDQELSANEAGNILGLALPLVLHRMDVGDLPFRTVGDDRRASLNDVLTLKERLDVQRASLDALARDTEDLIRNHGL